MAGETGAGKWDIAVCEFVERRPYTAVLSDSLDRLGARHQVECGDVIVNPGDLIFADYDSVIARPGPLVKEVVTLASDKAQREDGSRAELLAGGYLCDVFRKYGVL